jgi:hypothetical protein
MRDLLLRIDSLDLVLIAAAIVVGAMVRGGRLTNEPEQTTMEVSNA